MHDIQNNNAYEKYSYIKHPRNIQKMVLPFESSKKKSKIECILGNKQKYKIALILIVKS